jgi:hypothetical protein
LSALVDAHRCLVWFVARRDIAVGEEVRFDYSGDQTRPGRRLMCWFEAKVAGAR